MRPTCAAVLLFGLACSQAAEVDVESRQRAIIGGLEGAVGQHPTAVAVLNTGLCTGTLIEPDLVLTAAHCVDPQVLGFSSQAAVTAETIVVFDSQDAFRTGGTAVRSAVTIPHPEFASPGDNDIALIRLAEPVLDRRPTPINRLSEDAQPGLVVTQVGYGMSDAADQGSAGELNVLSDKVAVGCGGVGSDANLVCFAQTDGTGKCAGDSGGPSFATIGAVERVIGVTSFGDQTCTLFGADTRVDAELEFLFGVAPELQCQADGACNQECGQGDLAVDRDCVVCVTDADCAEGVCVASVCVAAPFSPGGLGSSCAKDADCDQNLCAPADDGGTCTQECSRDGDDCPDGFDCINAGSKDVCWPASGGCSTGGSGSGPAGLAAFLAMLLWSRRRRAIRCKARPRIRS